MTWWCWNWENGEILLKLTVSFIQSPVTSGEREGKEGDQHDITPVNQLTIYFQGLNFKLEILVFKPVGLTWQALLGCHVGHQACWRRHVLPHINGLSPAEILNEDLCSTFHSLNAEKRVQAPDRARKMNVHFRIIVNIRSCAFNNRIP